MTKALDWTGRSIPFLVPLMLIGTLVALAKSSLFEVNSSELATALTFDLLITVPLVYFLLIRKRDIPGITVGPVFILGIVISSLLLPADNRFLFDLAKTWMLPVVELSVFTVLVIKVRKTIVLFRREKKGEPDFYSALKKASSEILPAKVAPLFAMEISVIYYSFFVWRRRVPAGNEFSYHKESSIRILLGVFMFVILVETSVVHLLLQGWSVVAAWILSGLSIYTASQLFAILKSMSRRPIAIDEDILHLRHGLLSETEIPYSKIESIELSGKSIEFDKSTRHLSPFGEMDGQNVVIKLKEDHTMYGLYGMKKPFRTIAFHVDEKELFFELIRRKLQEI